MDKLSAQQRHAKAAIKREQSDASISSAEREQARRAANTGQHGMALHHNLGVRVEAIEA